MPATRAALFRASAASPHLVRFLHHESDVTAARVSGNAVVTGTRAGVLRSWTSRERLLRETGPAITALTVTDGGGRVVSGDPSGDADVVAAA